MKFIFVTQLLLGLLALCFCSDREELFYDVILIHQDSKKKVLLNEWKALVEESLHFVKNKHKFKNDDLNESHLIFWHTSGEQLNEKLFKSDKFKNGNKNIFVFLSAAYIDNKCFSKENIYRKLNDGIEKYKNTFMNFFQSGVKKSDEWKALEEILNLLMKSKEFRALIKNINTDSEIELLRQKIIELTEGNKNYKLFIDVLKENETIVNLLKRAENWKKFVKENYENLTKLLESYAEDYERSEPSEHSEHSEHSEL